MGGKGSGNPHPKRVPYDKNPVHQAHNPYDIDPEANSNGISMLVDMMKLPDIDLNDLDALEKRYFEYLGLCDKNDVKPMVAGLSFAFGMNRNILAGIARDDKKYANWHDLSTASRCFFKKIYEGLEILWENYLISEKGNPVKWLFLGKNHFGYKDQAERIVKISDETPQLSSPDAVADKYKAMVGKPTLELSPVKVEDVPKS